ncbi:MAG: DUF5667 domain-containing protein [bacterium]|nr:DUF5667 domain-containing protein [bacterium]
MFKNHKKAYLWFAMGMSFLGLMFFTVSLVATMSDNKMAIHERERKLYFDRKILPDHLFYPVLMAIDRLELEMSNSEEQTLLRMDYAGKRLEAAKALFEQDKNELAFITLGKAHQYLLQANNDILEQSQEARYGVFVKKLNQQFILDYQELAPYLSDAQKATVDGMIQELEVFNPKQVL